MTKDSNYLLFKWGLRLFKGLYLLFLPNVPEAMFIQGALCVIWVIFMKWADLRLEPLNILVFDTKLLTSSS